MHLSRPLQAADTVLPCPCQCQAVPLNRAPSYNYKVLRSLNSSVPPSPFHPNWTSLDYESVLLVTLWTSLLPSWWHDKAHQAPQLDRNMTSIIAMVKQWHQFHDCCPLLSLAGMWDLLGSGQFWGFPVTLVVKNPPASAGVGRDTGLIPGSGKSPGGGHGSPLQYSCLEHPMVREAWWATVPRVAKCQARVKQLSTGNSGC